MDAESGVGVALLDPQDSFNRIEGRRDSAINDVSSELLEKGQIFIGRFGGSLRAELDARGLRANGAGGARKSEESAAQRIFGEVTASHWLSVLQSPSGARA